MPDYFDEMDAAAGSYAGGAHAPPIRLRKTWDQRLAFAAANLAVLPVVAVCYQVVSSDGLRRMLPVFSVKLSRLPVPGAAYLDAYDGWNRLDGASLAAFVLFGAVTYLWFRLFSELVGDGPLAAARRTKPVLFWMLAAMAGVILAGDGVIFLSGLAAKTAGGWSDTPWYVPPLATVLFLSGQALIGWWHADWKHSGAV